MFSFTSEKGSAGVSHKILNIIIIVLLVIVAGLSFSHWKGGDSNSGVSIENEQLNTDTGTESKEEARRIVELVKKHIVIDEDIEPTVTTIVDVETLQKRNPFYNKANNGNHLVVTPDRAILYDAEQDKILDVIPVQIKPLEEQ